MSVSASSQNEEGCEKKARPERVDGLSVMVVRTVCSWAEAASCNGVPNIQRAKHPFRRFCWLMLVLTGTGLTIYQVVLMLIAYLTYPVNVHIIIDFSSGLNFPTVSICNVNQVRKSALPEFKSLLHDVLPHSYGKNITMGMETTAGRETIRRAFDDRWAPLNVSLQAAAGHQKERMILDCSFDGALCGPQNFSHYYNPVYGNCFAFNTRWEGQPLLKTHKPGPSSGLTLELFVEQEEYVLELTEDAGVRTLVHLDEQMPFPEDGGTLLPPGFMTLLSMRMTNITRLPTPFKSNCWDLEPHQSENNSVYSELLPQVEYTRQGCFKTCYQAHVVGLCNCGDPSFPLEGAAIRVHQKNRSMPIMPCQTPTETKCEAVIKTMAKANDLRCNCSATCNEIIFQSTGSLTQWPNNGLEMAYYRILEQNNPHIGHIFNSSLSVSGPRANLLKVKLFYEQLNQELITEQGAYTPITLFGDIGGLVGFYLGLSVVAMFEFIELVFDLIKACCRRCLSTKVKQQDSVKK